MKAVVQCKYLVSNSFLFKNASFKQGIHTENVWPKCANTSAAATFVMFCLLCTDRSFCCMDDIELFNSNKRLLIHSF